MSSDTKTLDHVRREPFVDRIRHTYSAFKSRYGHNIDHFLASYFGETSVIHRDAIVEAVNAGRFEDVEYVFDEFWSTFPNKRLANCELMECRSRGKCSYV